MVMKTLTKSILIVLCLTLLSSSQLFGQEWSAEQKEVLENMKTRNDIFAQKDIDGGMEYIHDNVISWVSVDSLPKNKTTLRNNISKTFETLKNFTYDIKPVAIKIYGNTAIICYYASFQFNFLDGTERIQNTRSTEICMKEGDKWVGIGNVDIVDK